MELFEDERINEINESLRLIEKRDSLTFGTDAYLLSAILQRRQKQIAVELGCGSGVVSLLALSRKKCQHVYGIEVQEQIASLAKRNALLNGLEDSLTIINKDLREVKISDISKEVDLVFSNPPYMKSTSGKLNENDFKNVSRHEVCGEIRDFCGCASLLLRHGGLAYFVYRPDRMIDLLSAMREFNLEPKKITFIHTNTNTPPSIFLVQGKKGAKGGLTVTKPIYVYKDNSTEYTEDFAKIYETCSMEHLL